MLLISYLTSKWFLVSTLLVLSAQTEFLPMNDKEEMKIVVLTHCSYSYSMLNIVFKYAASLASLSYSQVQFLCWIKCFLPTFQPLSSSAVTISVPLDSDLLFICQFFKLWIYSWMVQGTSSNSLISKTRSHASIVLCSLGNRPDLKTKRNGKI